MPLRTAVLSLLVLALALATGCAPFSELQGARLAGPGRTEITPGASGVSLSNDGETNDVYDHVGVQVARGLNETTDLRFRFERVSIDGGSSYNVFGMGPKFALKTDRSAIYLPVGLAFGEDIDDPAETLEFHPTFLFTVPLGRGVDLNPSGKALIPLNGDGRDPLFAINLGLALSTDPERWVIRPEIGYMFDPDADGHWRQFSLGLTLFP